MTIIKEIRENRNNNESAIQAGVYKEDDGSYSWITYTKSGNCKKLATAMKRIGS